MKKSIVAANWKMNLIKSEASKLASDLLTEVSNLNIYEKIELIIAPTFTSLQAVHNVIKNTQTELCAQNVFWMESGAYTGEISPGMLVDSGCKWVIIGHSERRYILNETDKMINKKVKLSLNCGLKLILCVGERKEDKELGNTLDVVDHQLTNALEDVDPFSIDNIVIAYEPVWAIGTGMHAKPEDAEDVHKNIKKIVAKLMDCNNEKVRVMYGGSVNTGNIKSLVSQPNIDGVLVGGASLDKDSFIEIIKLSGD